VKVRENRVSEEQRTEKWSFVENKGGTTCVTCQQSVSVPKVNNLRRHSETKHSKFNQQYSGEFRKQSAASLIQKVKYKVQ